MVWRIPLQGAAFLFSSVPPVATRALILLATSTLLAYLGWRAAVEGRLARLLLFGLVGELLVANAGLNPVLPASRLGPRRGRPPLRHIRRSASILAASSAARWCKAISTCTGSRCTPLRA